MVSENQFRTLFPFYFIIKKNYEVSELGTSLQKLLKKEPGFNFHDEFQIKRPIVNTDLFLLADALSNRLFLIDLVNSSAKLRGQFIYSDGREYCYFLGSPWITHPSQMADLGLNFNDFAVHDPITDVFMMNQQFEMNTDDLKKLTKRLEDEKNKVIEASRAKEVFLANMSHEIRTPMNAILGMSKLLKESELNETQLKYLNAISSSSDHLLVVINDILDFSKIQSGQLELENIDFNIKECLEGITEVLNYKAQDNGNKILLSYDRKSPDWIKGDEARIKQIVLNILNNAIKFTENDSILLNISSPQQGELYVSITDHGIGIDESKLDGIFESFTQEDSSTTRKYGGTGLGLAICKNMVELMGGQIGVTSKKGKGSTFYFQIPIVEGVPFEKEAKIEIEEFEHLNGIKILLAEDNKFNQMLATTILDQKGLVTTTVENGLQAVESIKNNEYDVVLMDIQMPEMGGVEAFQKIRNEMNISTPMIALTANALKGDKEKFIKIGFEGYTSKPFEPEQLYYEIARLLTKG